MMRTVESVVEKYRVSADSALVLGSGGGLTSLLLTKHFKEVN